MLCFSNSFGFGRKSSKKSSCKKESTLFVRVFSCSLNLSRCSDVLQFTYVLMQLHLYSITISLSFQQMHEFTNMYSYLKVMSEGSHENMSGTLELIKPALKIHFQHFTPKLLFNASCKIQQNISSSVN